MPNWSFRNFAKYLSSGLRVEADGAAAGAATAAAVSTYFLGGPLTLAWEVLAPAGASVPLGFVWTVRTGATTQTTPTLGFTWTVYQPGAVLGFTWNVLSADIFDLFRSDGTGAAAGIPSDILLPVGLVHQDD